MILVNTCQRLDSYIVIYILRGDRAEVARYPHMVVRGMLYRYRRHGSLHPSRGMNPL